MLEYITVESAASINPREQRCSNGIANMLA